MGIAYFDASALVKLVAEEDGSETAAGIWDGADPVVSSVLSYAEVRAALAAARRSGRLARAGLVTAKKQWERFWDHIQIVLPTVQIVVEAGDLAERHALRGYDAVHLASALALIGDLPTIVSWDVRMRMGASSAGLAVSPAAIE